MKPTNIESMMKQLHLPGMRSTYQELCDIARKENLSHEAFLESLLEQECITRRNNKIERLIRNSGIRAEKCRDTFDMNRLPKKILSRVNRLWDGDFLSRCENVLCFGNPGSGKSHLLSALGLELIKKGFRIEMYSCSILVQRLLIAKEQLNLEKFVKKLSKNDGLLIDDIGYVQQSREEMEVLFTLMAHCYETTSLLVSSNLAFSKWEQIFKDPMTTAAAIDRLVHHSIILELNVPSYRVEKAKTVSK